MNWECSLEKKLEKEQSLLEHADSNLWNLSFKVVFTYMATVFILLSRLVILLSRMVSVLNNLIDQLNRFRFSMLIRLLIFLFVW